MDGDAFIVRTAGYLYRIEDGFQRKAEPESTNEFIGSWDIGRPESGGKPKFVMTLNADLPPPRVASPMPQASGKLSTEKLESSE